MPPPSSLLRAAAAAAGAALWVHTPDISLELSGFGSSGGRVHLNTSTFSTSAQLVSWVGEPGTSFAVTSLSLGPCPAPNGASVCVERTMNVTGQLPSGACCAQYSVALLDEFRPVFSAGAPAAIAWTLTVSGASNASAWRSAIHTDAAWGFAAAAPADAAWWVPRGGALPDSGSEWADVLAMRTTGNAFTMLGNGFVYEADVAANREVMPLAMSAVASLANASGVALLHDPSDALLAAVQDAAAGGANFSRLYNRLGQGAAPLGKGQGGAAFTSFLIPLDSCDWRPAFAWARAALPSFFVSASLLSAAAPPPAASAPPPAHLATGLGLYTCAEASDVNASYLLGAATTTLWDAHFFWPYQGMFLPPNATWASNTGGGEQTSCGPGWRHGDVASRARIQASYDAATAAGLATLAYFNLFHFGESVRWPLPAPPSPPSASAWVDSSLFLAQNLSASVLPGPDYDWQNSIVLDPGEPTRAAFLGAQLQDKVASFGDSLAGIVVDELEPTHMINFAPASGGEGWDSAWCGQPCRFLLWGWTRAAAAAQRVLNGGGGAAGSAGARPRLLLANYIGAQRVDVLASADGAFTENYRNRWALANVLGLSTTGKPPAILWTNSAADMEGDPDGFFARHAYLKLFPMAPVLGSDHAIDPSAPAAVLQAYSDWGIVFAALRGGCWHLAGRPVLTTPPPPAVYANAFTRGGGCTDPATQGGNGPVGALLLVLWAPAGPMRGSGGGQLPVDVDAAAPQFLGGGAGALACAMAAPGSPAWTPLPAPERNSTTGRFRLQGVSLGPRGCAIVECTAA